MIKMARMAEPDELNCIQNSLAGDTEAYAALVKAHQKMVHAVAFRMTGSFADAEDLTQETFLRAFRQLDSAGNAGWRFQFRSAVHAGRSRVPGR